MVLDARSAPHQCTTGSALVGACGPRASASRPSGERSSRVPASGAVRFRGQAPALALARLGGSFTSPLGLQFQMELVGLVSALS